MMGNNMKRIVLSWFLLAQALCLVLVSAGAGADGSGTEAKQAFYTIVDAQGRLLTIPIDPVPAKAAPKPAKPKVSPTETKVAVASARPVAKPSAPASVAQPAAPAQPAYTAPAYKAQQPNIVRQENAAPKFAAAPQSIVVPQSGVAQDFGYTQPTNTNASANVLNDAVASNQKAFSPRADIFDSRNNAMVNSSMANTSVANSSMPQKSAASTQGANLATIPAAQAASVQAATATATTAQSSTSSNATNTQTSDTDGAVIVDYQDNEYIDSQELTEKQFNLEGKQRFYSLPDGMGGVELVKRESGVDVSQYVPKVPSQPVFAVSGNYQRLPAAQLTELLPFACAGKSALESAKILDGAKPLNIWPRNHSPENFAQNLVKLPKGRQQLAVISFADKAKNPSYYWPLAVFLDRNGCAIEAVGQFYQVTLPATWLQQSALKGNLLIPKSASYLLFTPLEQSPDLPKISLVQQGALTLKVLDGF